MDGGRQESPARKRESDLYYFAPIAGPERRLWAALVIDAVRICTGRTLAAKEEMIAARRWIEARGAEVGGFLWCCHLLGLDDEAIRAAIARAPRKAPVDRGRPMLGAVRPRGHRPFGARGVPSAGRFLGRY